jgi:hypothetical protein
MKITKSQLKQIIKEELQSVLRESEEKQKCEDNNGDWIENPDTGEMECDTSDWEAHNDPEGGSGA